MILPKSRTKNRIKVRTPSGNVVTHLRRKKNGKPTCPTGRPLPGTARGTPVQVVGMRKTERRPSRPYGGVLSSPAMRDLLRSKVRFSEPQAAATLFSAGAVCMKIAGRDAGKLCVITEDLGKGMVKVAGYTRERKVSTKHLEPTGKIVQLKKGAASKDVQALLA